MIAVNSFSSSSSSSIDLLFPPAKIDSDDQKNRPEAAPFSLGGLRPSSHPSERVRREKLLERATSLAIIDF
jgi:hypothetical protein